MPHTIAENLTRLQNATTAISNAITAKGGTVASGDGLEEFAADIATIPSGGGGDASKNDVNFYDYDGTIVNSYSATEFAGLSALPSNPSHEGLTARGWNWSLADAKTYVATYGKLNIGQMYTTFDGKTRLHIRLGESRLKPYLGLEGDSSGTAINIDWGDGSTAESVTLNTSIKFTPHEYTIEGDYTISITVTNGSISFCGDGQKGSDILRKSAAPNTNNDRVYQNSLISIEIGNNVTSIGDTAFHNCQSLTSITIPNTVTSIAGSAFDYCYSLTSITIPDGVTRIGDIGGTVFNYCYSLTSITIPNTVTSIVASAFNYCYSLTSITIPDGVTTISTFRDCQSLTSITIPNSVNSIGSNAFRNCQSLTSITIPNNITSIGNNAFNSCYGLGLIKFTSITPPTVSASTAWSNIPTDCIILAPALVINLYMDGTNYPSKSTYNYIGYATYTSGVSLPTTTTDETYTLTWYATRADAIAQTNPITQGTGSEVYARATTI